MENASKALLIAGGVLLALMIVSVMLYMSTKITEMGEAQNNRKAAEQLAAFNAEYEAYNKKLLYGTDVISVINKAIEHNNSLTIDETHKKFINIKFKLTEAFDGVTVTVKKKDGKIQPYYQVNTGSGLQMGKYELKTVTAPDEYEVNPAIINFLNQKNVNLTNIDDTDADVIKYEYDGIQEFKRAIFTCNAEPVYNNEGQIIELSFEQTGGATFQIN